MADPTIISVIGLILANALLAICYKIRKRMENNRKHKKHRKPTPSNTPQHTPRKINIIIENESFTPDDKSDTLSPKS